MLNGLGKAFPSLSFCYFVKLSNLSFFMALLIAYTIKKLLTSKKIRFSNFFFNYQGRRNCIYLLMLNMILFFLELASYPLTPKGNLNMLFRVPC